MQADTEKRVRAILAEVKPLAADIMGLTLAPARTAGYDALRGTERIQIKGRAYRKDAKPGQRISRIKPDAPCDTVMLVLLDNTTLETRQIWEAPYAAIDECLQKPGSKARERGSMSVSAFKARAQQVWPADNLSQPAKKA